MKMFLVNSWIDDRQVLSNEKVPAGNMFVAIAKAGRLTRAAGNWKRRAHHSKLSVRVVELGRVDTDRGEIIPADRFLPAERI